MFNFYVCITILVVIILLLLYILHGCYKYWLRPDYYKEVDYNDIVFKTGDIIMYKSANSYHAPIFHTDFAHPGIIVVINKNPYIMDLVKPFSFLTHIKHQLMSNDGTKYYYKKINQKINQSTIDKIKQFILKAENIMYKSNIVGITGSSDNEMICYDFIYNFLVESGILDSNLYNGENYIDFIANLTKASNLYSYDEVKKIKFHVAHESYSLTDITDMLLSGIDVEGHKHQILNMPVYKGLWKRMISDVQIT